MSWVQFLATLIMNPLWMWPEMPLKYEVGEVVMYQGMDGEVKAVKLQECIGRVIDGREWTVEEYWMVSRATESDDVWYGAVGDRFFTKLRKRNWTHWYWDVEISFMGNPLLNWQNE